MDIWREARDCYTKGGITQKELAEKFGLSVSSLRKRAAAEKWSELKRAQTEAGFRVDAPVRGMRVSRQLRMTDRMLDIVENALNSEDELFGWVEFWKSTAGGEFACERLRFLNDERFGRLIRTAADIFELQRTVLEIHEYKDEVSAQKYKNDAQLAQSKLKQQTELAERRLELELLKLERNQDTGCEPDGFLSALGLADGEEENEQTY